VEEGLGLTLSALTPEVARQLGAEGSQGGAVVTRVRPASPAAEAGVQTGDVVIEVNREPVRSLDATMSRVRTSAGAGAATFLLVLRDGQRVFLVVGKPE
jgi:serine protease Do